MTTCKPRGGGSGACVRPHIRGRLYTRHGHSRALIGDRRAGIGWQSTRRFQIWDSLRGPFIKLRGAPSLGSVRARPPRIARPPAIRARDLLPPTRTPTKPRRGTRYLSTEAHDKLYAKEIERERETEGARKREREREREGGSEEAVKKGRDGGLTERQIGARSRAPAPTRRHARARAREIIVAYTSGFASERSTQHL